MKYPQLVSTRAVNAISDWLVSRLEQLGVEAPLIYSRLLLSLLHSSVQINDPIEFNNLETYIVNRKGNKRIPPCDTETLKKITAIQCLMDAVSSEQEISKVEHLVDELCEKLSDIEKQTNEEELHQVPQTLTSVDIEDPRKRYYRAFPALSKEMEDSVWLSKINTKALTWPNGNTGTSSSSVSALCNTAGVKRKQKRRRNQAMCKGKTANIRKNSFGGSSSPTWDTDFEGSWEMGRDLIKEFIIMQNNRNRSTSESDACNIRKNENLEKRMKPMDEDRDVYYSLSQSEIDLKSETNVDISLDDEASSEMILHTFPLSGIVPTDDEYSTNDALTSMSEVDSTSNMARRLYEREISTDSLNLLPSEQNDFAQFAAKFDSSVEALWKDDNDNEKPSKPPNHQNLENFWTNYYNHHYDTEKFANNNTIESKHDFFSMPANMGKQLDDCSIKVNPKKNADGKFVPPAGMYLRDPVWSDKPQKNYEEEDSFYAKVLGSSYKNNGNSDNLYEAKDPSYSFNISKWSECSFETPFIPPSSPSSSTENFTRFAKNDLRENMLRNSYLYNYRQPVAPSSTNLNKNNNIQAAPMSLPEFYGPIEIAEKNLSDENLTTQTESSISLTNHSKTSGFIEYTCIKSIVKFEPIKEIQNVEDKRKTEQQVSLSPSSEEENLLTSERTHFRPIKQSYADGHQFEISSNFDEIEFHRSESGYLYLESEKYLEYKRLDAFGSDDEPLGHGNMRERSREFPLKFRIKQIEKYCQTDESISEGYIVATHLRNINRDSHNNGNHYIIEKGLSENSNYLKDESSVNIDQWSMAEIGKKCLDNNNTHTLWGLCPACNNVNKSIPANRLLKDELNLEADEIMSDLKYMQNLYIGSDWEDDEDDTDGDAEMIKDCELYQPMEPQDEDEEQEQIFYNVTKLIADLLKPENAKSLADALGANQNKNLFRGMYADDGKNSANLNYADKIDKTNIIWKSINNNNFSNNNNNNEKYIGGLWSDDENIIWKKELKPLNDNIWSQIDDSKTASFLEDLNWKHSNLAEIWNTKLTADKQQNADFKGKHIEQNMIKCSEISSKNMKNLISWNISPQNKVKTSKDLHEFQNKSVNRFDRKRRHSASQNVNTGNSSGGVINNDNIIIGNKIEVMAKRDLDYCNLTSIDTPTTIITCKYWTTIDTSASPFFMDKSSHYDGICTLAMNPSSILKHVALVSRPLTR